MKYIVYKVTNNINSKFYIGTHKTQDVNDGYMGSGKYLKHSQEKHGLENFSKEILFIFNNPEEMFKKEAEIVNEDFLAEENTYNLKAGGFGGWDYINKNNIPSRKGKKHKQLTKNKISDSNKGRIINNEHKNKISKSIKKHIKENGHNWTGKVHTEESKLKMSNSVKSRKLESCIYCGFSTYIKTNIIRWHNENCKKNSGEVA